MEKRYQVFVSSTFQDLEEERQEVMHALLELDCIPSGMELFPAANEAQWNLIKRVIDDCDYYLLILGGRYGSIGPDGYSYTEMEFRYAESSGKPIVCFVHRSPGKIISERCESTQEGKEKLAAFRAVVEKRLCKQWESPQELGSVVSRSIVQLIKTTPAVGWVRASELPEKEATLELLQLRRRVEELQSELEKNRITAPKGSETLSQGDEVFLIRYTFESRDHDTYATTQWNSSFSASWNEIFSCVAPIMINEATEYSVKSALNAFIESRNTESLYKDKRLKNSRLNGFSIDQDDFHTIKIQFRALGLIVQSEKARSIKDSSTYWTLTPYGDEVMTQVRAIRRGAASSPVSEPKLQEGGAE